MTTANSRTAAHPIDPLFLERWSPRAFTNEPIPERELLTLFEAALGAVVLQRPTVALHLCPVLRLLNAYNQSWAKNAAADPKRNIICKTKRKTDTADRS